jgi:hypothetical protein
MTHLLVVLTVLASSSAVAEMSQFCNNQVGDTIYGRSPNPISQYYDSRGSVGTIFNNPPSGLSQYYFSGPSGMMRESRTIF